MSEATQITQETLLQLSRNDAQFEDRLTVFLDQVRAVTDLIWASSQNEQCQLDDETVGNAMFALHMDAHTMTKQFEKWCAKGCKVRGAS